MDTLTLEVSVPNDLLAALGFSRAHAAQQVKEFTVLGLYRERRISAGKAAEMLGLHLGEFVRLLARKDVPYFDSVSSSMIPPQPTVKSRWTCR